MHAAGLFRRVLAGLLCSAIWLSAAADSPCLVAYDLGSSGIRAGASNSGNTVRVELDALRLLAGRHPVEDAVAPTAAALGELRSKGGFDPACRQLGGGFSAWRLALERNAATLAAALARIHAASGVPIVVIPQAQEGAYGYLGAQRILGDRLLTTHVLDIGGGSLQVAGKDSSFGDTLGQKLWQAELCRALGRSGLPRCALQPLGRDELAAARALLAERLQGIRTALPQGATMTSISRPVSRGVQPALLKLAVGNADAEGFRLAAVTAAIEKLRGLGLEETGALTGIAPPYVAYLFSDLLLVEGLLLATGGDSLRVAEVDLTNVPGLLADERTAAWGAQYACYLDRLKASGLRAYFSDPATCR